MALAIVRKSDGKVQTFVRDDVPQGWTPPEGFDAIPESQLPIGWQRIPPDAPELPESITKYQCQAWLWSTGLLPLDKQVDDLIEMLITDEDSKRDALARWRLGQSGVLRSDPIIESAGVMLGLSLEQLDEAFLVASRIQ